MTGRPATKLRWPLETLCGGPLTRSMLMADNVMRVSPVLARRRSNRVSAQT